MGSIFRSEEMTLCQLFLSSEAAYNCVSELGEIGLVQFRDLNPDVNAFQRKFVHEVRRCDEMERKLRYLETEMKKDKVAILDNGENPEAPQPREMIDLEATFEKLENEMKEVNSNAETLKKNSLELTELKHVLMTTQLFFDEHEVQSTMNIEQRDSEPSTSITQNLLPAEEGKGPVQLGFVAGVTLRERMPMFERMLWRVCRGNVFVRRADIQQPLEDPITGEEVFKTVFIIFFQGEQLKTKVKKICEGCRATMYPCPEASAERKEMAQGVKGRLDDLTTVLSQTTDHRRRVLAAAAKHLRTWFIKVRKIKAIYHTLNMLNLDVTNKCLIAECWIPTSDLGVINDALRKGTERSGSSVQPILNRMQTQLKPPTFHRTNKFTSGFQNLIDAYGVATYREVNPALYTTTTFPFLFAVMFGDAGHGLLMLAFAAWMVIREKALIAAKMSGEIWNIFFGGRYIILLMSCFSIYTGIIYNDVFSKSFNIFGSSWHINPNATVENLEHWEELTLDPAYREEYTGKPYPFGFDPMWQIAVNKIAFQNSYKMKISIIIGVIHMIFGVVVSLYNHTFFRNYISLIFEFIPQMIFLVGMFGWLCVMVFIKWIMYGAGPEFSEERGSFCAPSVLITFINMVLLKKEKEDPTTPCKVFMFEGQYIFQLILLILCIICVPLMLFPKPLILKSLHNKKRIHHNQQAIAQNGELGGEATTSGHGEEEEEFEFSEVFIEQAIHTIEFVLGSVSHTASYLRLWALSLAHAQLSEVLWNMVMKIGLSQSSYTGSIMLYLIFAAWAALTISILVLMEGLSAFLHTLRLHWVEFQSKFYKGEGYAFTPLTFKHIVSGDEEEA
ncbi:V-type proton ATPase 116 kDa subunit a1-like isoform X1 [Penaeus monodon]|uniref:V-type proton ATPase 116 kDa subunit a1-like isoform X1 n=1 Tax=Penaeus monodon TaxID=6687 RepID=UPI0018A7D17C|nr:V-type proton ATPase 116 kDa subunit a1-like isoform X1 [Penaeus monodon]